MSRPSRPTTAAQPEKPLERDLGSDTQVEIDLKQYDWRTMPLGFSWYIFGGSGKGKTILLENILYHNARRFHSGFI
jgi:predicted ATPase